jgi:colanic acid/amylovoran biosynthesis protein
MREADAVVIKGGGFMYAYRSPTYAYYLWYVCYHTRLAQRLGVPVAILPNSFGPFETAFSRRFIARLLDRCALVATRESVSQKELDRLIPGKAKPFPDMAFLLRVGPEDRAWARTELQSNGVRTDGRAVGITMRPWRFPGHPDPSAAYDAYLNAMAQFIVYLRERGFQPVLFAHVQGPGSHEMDRLALDACRQRFADDPPVLVDGDYDCVQVKALYSHLGYMVGTRFHSCIFAMAQAIPTLAIGYQGYKASGIMSDMELGAFSVDIEHLTAEALVERFSLLVERREEAVEHGRAYVEKAAGRLAELGPLLAAAIGCGDAS